MKYKHVFSLLYYSNVDFKGGYLQYFPILLGFDDHFTKATKTIHVLSKDKQEKQEIKIKTRNHFGMALTLYVGVVILDDLVVILN